MSKDIFIDGYERADLVKNCANFLKKIKKLNLFLVEFNKDGTIKPKIYFFNCIVENEDFWPIIVITYNKYIYLANNRIQKAWTQESDIFLRSKRRE